MLMGSIMPGRRTTNRPSEDRQRAIRASRRWVGPGVLAGRRGARLLVADVEALGDLDEQTLLAAFCTVRQLQHPDGHVHDVAVSGDEIGHQAETGCRRVGELRWHMLVFSAGAGPR